MLCTFRYAFLLPLALIISLLSTSSILSAPLPLSTKELLERAQHISELPTPQPRYELVYWSWRTQNNISQAKNKPKQKSKPKETKRQPPPSVSEQIKTKLREIFAFQGQGHLSTLYEDIKNRSQRQFNMDLFTNSTQDNIPYVVDFEPSVAPFKRETVWNHVDKNGQVSIKVGQIKKVLPFIIPEIATCLSHTYKPDDTQSRVQRLVSINQTQWVEQDQLDLECVQQRCALQGGLCFLARIQKNSQPSFKTYLTIPSVAAEQYLVSTQNKHFFDLGKDRADNYYLKYANYSLVSTHILQQKTLYYLVYAPYHYFSGSWIFANPIAHTNGHFDIKLPKEIRQQARSLFSRLNVKRRGVFQNQLYKLVEWFRSFENQTIPMNTQGSTYEKLVLSQRGVCRHRSYAFMITARALGLPTRYVTNQTHAFVEVLDPENHWRRIDLGGEGAFQVQNHSQSQSMTGKRGRLYQAEDGLPAPPIYQAALDRVQKKLTTRIDLDTSPSNTTQPSVTAVGVRKDKRNQIENPPYQSSKTTVTPQVNQVSLVKTSAQPTSDLKKSEIQSESQELKLLEQDRDGGHALTSEKGLFVTQECENIRTSKTKIKLPKVYPGKKKRLTVTVFVDEDVKLARCEILTIKGKVSYKNRMIKGVVVQAYLVNQGSLIALPMLARSDRRGKFTIKTPLPVRLSLGTFNVIVHVPAQKRWQSAWSLDPKEFSVPR